MSCLFPCLQTTPSNVGTICVLHNPRLATQKYINRYLQEQIEAKKKEFLNYCFSTPGKSEIYKEYCKTHHSIEELRGHLNDLKKMRNALLEKIGHSWKHEYGLAPAQQSFWKKREGCTKRTSIEDEVLYRKQLDTIQEELSRTYSSMWHKTMVLKANGLD